MGWAAHRAELLRRADEDQEVRHVLVQSGLVGPPPVPGDERHEEFTTLTTRMRAVDARNREWFRALVHDLGWPASSEVGSDGGDAAWLLAQHADEDPEFQRTCLDLAAALPATDVNSVRLAMLTDRVMLKERGVQRFGTQWTARDGDLVPLALEDAENVDELRRSVGLDTLEDNRVRIAAEYGRPGRTGA